MTGTEDENEIMNAEVDGQVGDSSEVLPVYVPGPNAVDLTPNKDGGVTKEILREGTGTDYPMSGDKVFVHYVGTLTNGVKFDSSRDRGEKFDFSLGKGNVIKAWDLGVATMKRGELAVLQCKSEYAYGAAGSPPKIPANATLVFEIELFDWTGEDVSNAKDGGILKSVIHKGEGYLSPKEGATVNIHIIGRHNGRVFEDRDVEFIIGEGSEAGIVDGVEQALLKFKKEERSRLKVKPVYGYGVIGCPQHDIPANADLEFEVELKKFEKAKESWEMDVAEKIEQCEINKAKGTQFFKDSCHANKNICHALLCTVCPVKPAKDQELLAWRPLASRIYSRDIKELQADAKNVANKFKIALRYYAKIVDYLKSEETCKDGEAESRRNLLLAAHLNLAMCHLKLGGDLEACKACDEALKIDPVNEKGLFRRGTAQQNLQNFELALTDFQAVLAVDPENKAAKHQIAIVNQKIKHVREKERQTYAGMFQKFAAEDAKKQVNEPIKESKKNKENGKSMDVSSSSSEELHSSGDEMSPRDLDTKGSDVVANEQTSEMAASE